ncbi:hypothetical protein [Akkermansia massiliensis]
MDGFRAGIFFGGQGVREYRVSAPVHSVGIKDEMDSRLCKNSLVGGGFKKEAVSALFAGVSFRGKSAAALAA